MVTHRLVELDTRDARRRREGDRSRLPPNGYALELVTDGRDEFRVKVSRLETSAAHHVTVPVELLASPIVRATCARATRSSPRSSACRRSRSRTAKRAEAAETFEQLRELALDLAKEGIQLSRFKGLGEMNDEQLWETTMDPARRLLIRVDVEDASAADRLFSMLMGDQVEPRRAVHRSRTRRTCGSSTSEVSDV